MSQSSTQLIPFLPIEVLDMVASFADYATLYTLCLVSLRFHNIAIRYLWRNIEGFQQLVALFCHLPSLLQRTGHSYITFFAFTEQIALDDSALEEAFIDASLLEEALESFRQYVFNLPPGWSLFSRLERIHWFAQGAVSLLDVQMRPERAVLIDLWKAFNTQSPMLRDATIWIGSDDSPSDFATPSAPFCSTKLYLSNYLDVPQSELLEVVESEPLLVWQALSQWESLVHVKISRSTITPQLWKALAGIPRLAHLTLEGCSIPPNGLEAGWITNQSFMSLSHFGLSCPSEPEQLLIVQQYAFLSRINHLSLDFCQADDAVIQDCVNLALGAVSLSILEFDAPTALTLPLIHSLGPRLQYLRELVLGPHMQVETNMQEAVEAIMARGRVTVNRYPDSSLQVNLSTAEDLTTVLPWLTEGDGGEWNMGTWAGL